MGTNKWDNKFKFTQKFGKTPKIHKNKVENPWTPSKQIKKPPNFKTIPPKLFPPMWNLQNDKKKIEDSGISKYKNRNFQNSHEEKHIPYFHAYENFGQKNWKPQNDKKETENFRTSKY